MEHLIAPAVNVLILIGILFYYLREPTKTYVHSRHLSIRDELQRVTEQLRTAQKQYDEFSSKLKAIDAEVQALRNQAKQDAQSLRVKVLAEAAKHASSIVSDAKLAASNVFTDLKVELRRELGTRVLERAEAMLRERLTQDDRTRIRHDFSRQMEAIQ